MTVIKINSFINKSIKVINKSALLSFILNHPYLSYLSYKCCLFPLYQGASLTPYQSNNNVIITGYKLALAYFLRFGFKFLGLYKKQFTLF